MASPPCGPTSFSGGAGFDRQSEPTDEAMLRPFLLVCIFALASVRTVLECTTTCR